MEVESLTPEKENTIRNKFHRRGLSSKSKSSSSDDSLSSPLSSKDPLANLKQFIPRREILSELYTLNSSQRECRSDEQLLSESIVEKKCPPENVDGRATPECINVPLPELQGTPSVSLRKDLLSKKYSSSVKQHSQDLSPNLQKLRSTPALDKVRSAVQSQLENSLMSKSFTIQAERESPGLTRLRQTPGKPLREKRRDLEDKHNETRQHADTLNVGGGVSLWPDMDNMRLTRRELVTLTAASVLLMALMSYLFDAIHGNTITKLQHHSRDIEMFRRSHPIDISTDERLSTSSIRWHEDFNSLLNKVDESFSVSSANHASTMFYISASLYLCGVSVLLYYLADNVMSSSKLSPNRIKKWVCLLVVVGTWTINMCRMFSAALTLEQSVEDNIQWLNAQQKHMIYHDINPGGTLSK